MSKSQYYQNDNLNEIIKGFEMFDVENKGIINPLELKETMEEMNLKDKNPFIYELISSLCSNKDIISKGGLTSEEFISFLEEKISDVESREGIKTIFEVFSDSDNKIPMPTFYQTAREVGDEEGGIEIKDLVQKSKTGGKELDFEEFYEIMKENNPINNNNQYKNKYINNHQEEYEVDYENIPAIQKSGFIIVDKVITEQLNEDSPVKISRYHYKYNNDGTLKESEKSKSVINDLNMGDINNVVNETGSGQRFHRYKESKVTTEKVYQSNTTKTVSYNNNIVPTNNTNIVYTRFKTKKDK